MKRNGYDRVIDVPWGELSHTLEPDAIYVVADEEDKPYAVDFLCPCGCGAECWTPVSLKFPDGRHRWGFNREVDKETGRPLVTLSPSIMFTGGCKSHFFIQQNRVRWC